MEFAEPFWPADSPFIGCCPMPPSLTNGTTSGYHGTLENDCHSVTPSEKIAPIFLENYLWSKGVPVLTAAVSGERGRLMVAAAAAAAKAAKVSEAAGVDRNEEDWQGVYARELYRKLMLPALRDALGKNGDIPEPVSVVITK